MSGTSTTRVSIKASTDRFQSLLGHLHRLLHPYLAFVAIRFWAVCIMTINGLLERRILLGRRK